MWHQVDIGHFRSYKKQKKTLSYRNYILRLSASGVQPTLSSWGAHTRGGETKT